MNYYKKKNHNTYILHLYVTFKRNYIGNHILNKQSNDSYNIYFRIYGVKNINLTDIKNKLFYSFIVFFSLDFSLFINSNKDIQHRETKT